MLVVKIVENIRQTNNTRKCATNATNFQGTFMAEYNMRLKVKLRTPKSSDSECLIWHLDLIVKKSDPKQGL